VGTLSQLDKPKRQKILEAKGKYEFLVYEQPYAKYCTRLDDLECTEENKIIKTHQMTTKINID